MTATKTDRTISDLTVGELRDLIRQTVRETMAEYLGDSDPDEGLEFKPEVAEYLRKALKEKRRGTPLVDVKRELGLDG